MTTRESPSDRTVEDGIAVLVDIGYVVVPAALDEQEVEALRVAVPPPFHALWRSRTTSTRTRS